MNESIRPTRDGFELVKDRFAVPKDTSTLDPRTRQAVKICNLFLNDKMGVGDIVRLLNEDRGRVVLALLEQGIVQDRRCNPR
jgi:hypothetical protein